VALPDSMTVLEISAPGAPEVLVTGPDLVKRRGHYPAPGIRPRRLGSFSVSKCRARSRSAARRCVTAVKLDRAMGLRLATTVGPDPAAAFVISLGTERAINGRRAHHRNIMLRH